MNNDEGLWSALMRRKVVKTVALYLAASWVAIQAASLLANIWSLPSGFVQGVFLLLVIGLPVTTMFSWVYDIRDEGLVATGGSGFGVLLRARLRRSPGGTLSATLVFALALFVGIAYAWPDDALSLDAERLLSNTQQRDDDPHNFTYGLYGFSAPAGSDFWSFGRYRVEVARTLADDDQLAMLPTGYTVDQRNLCTLRVRACYDEIIASLDATPVLLEANAAPLARYHELQQARSFGDAFGRTPNGYVSVHTPPYVETLWVGNRLTLRHALLLAERGELVRAQALLAQEDAFYRRMMSQGHDIFVKVLAIARVSETARATALIIDRAARRSVRGVPMTAPARLTAAERSLATALSQEAAWYAQLGSSEHDRGDLISANTLEHAGAKALIRILPYRPRATANRLVAEQLHRVRDSLLSARDYANRPDQAAAPIGPLDWYTNAVGVIVWTNQADFGLYIKRIHDLDALLVLTQVTHRLHAQRVTADQVPAALLALPPELRDPANGKSPTWTDGMLRFERKQVMGRDSETWLPFTPTP